MNASFLMFQDCPEGLVHETAFRDIYAKFFPHGSKYIIRILIYEKRYKNRAVQDSFIETCFQGNGLKVCRGKIKNQDRGGRILRIGCL